MIYSSMNIFLRDGIHTYQMSDYQVLYYFVNWGIYARKYFVSSIPDEVDDIVYAFYNVTKDGASYYHLPVSGDPHADFVHRFTQGTEGAVEPYDKWYYGEGVTEDPFYGNFNQIRKVQEQRRQQGRKLNVRLSLGGWTWSKHFSSAVRTAESRAAFVSRVVATFETYPIFTGLDIDWEYISPPNKNYGLDGNEVHADDPANFIKLLTLLKSEFAARGWDYPICCAVVAAPEKTEVLPIEEMNKLGVNFLLMTYDFDSSAWGDTIANHHTNLYPAEYTKYSVDAAVKHYLSKGVPSKRIFIGSAFYSRGFANTDGLGKPASGMPSEMTWEKGVCDYKVLPPAGFTEYYDEKCEAAYCYSAAKRELISYDNPRSVKAKCDFVKKHNLGGILVWELSGDHPVTNSRSLVKLLHDELLVGGHQPPQLPPVPLPPKQPEEDKPAPPPAPPAPLPPKQPEEEEPVPPTQPPEQPPVQVPMPAPPMVSGKVKQVHYTGITNGNTIKSTWEYEYFDDQ